MGGDVGAESTPGQGSTFWITTHLGQGATPAPPFSAPHFPALPVLRRCCSGKHVLLVDDDPLYREVIMIQLEDSGLVVSVAENGAEALERAAQQRFDLILMDLQMPVMNGVCASLAIRHLDGYTQKPILALTANTFEEDRQACLAAGMDEHIAKPVTPDALYATILRWLTHGNGA